MGAALDDPPVVQHQHHVGVADRAQPVGHHKAGSVFEQNHQGLLDAGFGDGVHGTGGLIQNNNTRVGQQSPGETDKLPLAQ